MKKKITISLDEEILKKIDIGVEKRNDKNRSFVIERVLKEKYGSFHNTTAIIFAYDYKWDNRAYPFDIPKSLLEIREKSIIKRQIEIFSKPWVTNFVILIPHRTISFFQDELISEFPYLSFQFIEINQNLQTGEALREWLQGKDIEENIIIANGDIFYGNLDLWKYYRYHKTQKSDFSFCLKFVMNPEQLGNVLMNGNHILEFVEKPQAKATYLTNSGLYITTRTFLQSHDFWLYLEHDFFPEIPNIANVIGFIYSWEWEHIQNDSAFERVNGELI